MKKQSGWKGRLGMKEASSDEIKKFESYNGQRVDLSDLLQTSKLQPLKPKEAGKDLKVFIKK